MSTKSRQILPLGYCMTSLMYVRCSPLQTNRQINLGVVLERKPEETRWTQWCRTLCLHSPRSGSFRDFLGNRILTSLTMRNSSASVGTWPRFFITTSSSGKERTPSVAISKYNRLRPSIFQFLKHTHTHISLYQFSMFCLIEPDTWTFLQNGLLAEAKITFRVGQSNVGLVQNMPLGPLASQRSFKCYWDRIIIPTV